MRFSALEYCAGTSVVSAASILLHICTIPALQLKLAPITWRPITVIRGKLQFNVSKSVELTLEELQKSEIGSIFRPWSVLKNIGGSTHLCAEFCGAEWPQ